MKSLRITITCLLMASAAMAQHAVSLQYHFTKGDRFRMQQQSTQDSYLTIQGVSQRTTRQLNDTLLLTVTAVNSDGTASIEAQFKSIFILASGNDQQMTISTHGGGNDIFNTVFRKLIGQPFTITMTPAGDIKNISGLDDIISNMLKAVAGKSADEQEAFKTLLQSQFGPGALKAQLQQVLPQYPDHTVRAGDGWMTLVNTEGTLSGQTENFWKMTYGDQYGVSLSCTGKFSTDPGKTVSLGSGMEGTINLNGEIQGQYTVDAQTGWSSTCVLHTEVSGQYNYNPNPKMKKGMQVPVRIVGDAQYKVLHL